MFRRQNASSRAILADFVLKHLVFRRKCRVLPTRWLSPCSYVRVLGAGEAARELRRGEDVAFHAIQKGSERTLGWQCRGVRIERRRDVATRKLWREIVELLPVPRVEGSSVFEIGRGKSHRAPPKCEFVPVLQ